MNKSLGKAKYLYVFLLVLSLLMYLVAPVFPNKVRADNDRLVSLSHTSEIDRLIELCIRTIKGEVNFQRPLVEKAIDLVIVQDASGSFTNTIGTMKDGLKAVVDKLVFSRGDRVMVTTFRGGQRYQWYEVDDGSQVKKNVGSNNGLFTGSGDGFITVDTKTPYALGNGFTQAKDQIGTISVNGATPTARGLQYALKGYNDKRGELGDAGDLMRETVFLLVTDGVANVRLPDGSTGDDGTIWLDWDWAYGSQSHGNSTGFNEKYQDYKTATDQAAAQATAIKGQGYYLISTFIQDLARQTEQYGGGDYYTSVVGPYTRTKLESMATSDDYFVVFDTPANFGTVAGNLFDALVEEISQESIEVVIESGYQVLSSRLLKDGVVINANLGLHTGSNIVEVEQEGDYTIEYELRELDFYGEDKTPVTAIGRSGQKRYHIENPVIPGNTNTICTLEPTVPVKRVNGVEHYDLSQVREEVTYTVTTHVDNIFGMTSFGFEDQVDALLKITAGSADVKVDGVSIVKPGELTVIGNKITFSKTSDFTQIKEKDVVLEFKASIDACVICGEVKAIYPDGKIPNTAQLIYNGHKTNSNTVTIAPPAPVTPQISKDINGKTHENLAAADDSFNYHVKVLLPQLEEGEYYRTLVIDDTLEPVLQIQGTAVLIDGVAVPALDAFVSIAGQKVTLSLDEEDFDFADIIGKVIALEITAVIRDGADLSVHEGELVPNEGYYSVNGNQKVKSNKVTVTPPPDEPVIDKDVNGKAHEDLGSRHELFTYHVLVDIPESVRGYESIVVSDTLESVLEIVSSKVTVGTDDTLLAPYLTISDQTATLVLDSEFDFSRIEGEQIVIELVARIKIGANLDAYLNDTVPNQAAIQFNDKPQVMTEPVTVTPPAEPPEIEKDVNGKEHEDLTLFDQVFTYHVELEIPNNTRDYASLVLTDTLEDVLEIIEAAVLLDGSAEPAVSPYLDVSGQTVSLILDETFDFSLLARKTITLVIGARIREGADLTPYEGETIPNQAEYLINDQIGTKSNIVTVTPPFEFPVIDKDVNGKEHEDLAARDEVFTYHVRVRIPDYAGRYESLVILDTLEDVLERGEATVFVDGLMNASLTARLEFDGQTIRLVLDRADLAHAAGKQITLRIEAKIRAGADLSEYEDETVPNRGRLILNKDIRIDSNMVTVTPPPEKPSIKKEINGKLHEDLEERDEIFTYQVKVEIPVNVRGYESLILLDTLEDVLGTRGVRALVDGVELPALTGRITIDGQEIRLVLDRSEDFDLLAGKTLILEIGAQILEDADLSAYTDETVPNKALLLFNEDPGVESNVVTVTPPEELVEGDTDELPKTGGFFDRTFFWAFGVLLMAAGTLVLLRLKYAAVREK